MSEEDNLLETQDLVLEFPGVRALDGMNFQLKRGEIHALCGENGAGKSSLIKCLSGIWPHGRYGGSILLKGSEVSFQSLKEANEVGIAVIHQELALVPELSIAENFFLGREPMRGLFVDWETLHRESHRALVHLGLEVDVEAPISSLGTGQQQLVEIARAIDQKGKVLILDEPTAALTEKEVKVLLEILTSLKSQGVSCLYISHKLDEVFAVADRITVLRDGESIVSVDAVDCTEQDLISHMVGRELVDLFPSKHFEKGDRVLSVEELSVTHQGKEILHGLSFQVRSGEVLGIGGLMGAGRSELLLHLMGAHGIRSRGRVQLLGREVCWRQPHEAIEDGVVLVSEDRKDLGLHLEQSIDFNLSLSSLKHLGAIFLDCGLEQNINRASFEKLGVKAPGLQTGVGTLSGGNQQKVVLGKALNTHPKLILLDEPTRGIDIGAKQEIYHLIGDLCQQGLAVVLVSSELPELMGLSDRIMMLAEGRMGGLFDSAPFSQEALLQAAIPRTPLETPFTTEGTPS